jgi:hypothetical protein
VKRTVLVALLFGAGALALILAIVIGVAASVGTGNTAKTPVPSDSVEGSPAPDSAAPTATPVIPTPSESVAPAPTPQPANPQTIVARRGINPLYQLIELSCDEPDSIDVDSWRIDGDNVIYRVSDYDTDWSSTATTSFAALEAGASPVFITDAADWQSNGCFP